MRSIAREVACPKGVLRARPAAKLEGEVRGYKNLVDAWPFGGRSLALRRGGGATDVGGDVRPWVRAPRRSVGGPIESARRATCLNAI